MANISKINVNGTEYNIDSVTVNGHTVNSNVPLNYSFEDNNKAFYATCDSTEETYNKVATIQNSSSFSLTVGVTVFVKFAYSNHYNPPGYTPTLTLNVNSTGQKPIQYVSGSDVGNDERSGWEAGSVVPLTYDGTAWVINGFRKYYIPGSGLSEQNVSGVNSYTMLKHSNNITAQNTQAVYPIKIDSNGHIKAYGEAVTIPDNNRKSFYATCSTAADVKDKVATLANSDGWELKPGTIVGVRYTNSNTYNATAEAEPTLNVNNTGAKPFYYNNSSVITGTNNSVFGAANRIAYYMYDGTYWCWMIDGRHDGNTDTKVRQTLDTSNTNRPLLLAYSNNSTTTGNVDNISYRNNSIYANASTGTITATKFTGQADVTLQASDITIANGDKLVVTDSSNSNKASRASISFDGSTTSKYLSKKGTWEGPFSFVGMVVSATNLSTEANVKAIYGSDTSWALLSSVMLASENIVGNGYTLGLTDGTNLGGMRSRGDNASPSLYGVSAGATQTSTLLNNNVGIGVPTKSQLGANPQYSGLIADTVVVYTWERTS